MSLLNLRGKRVRTATGQGSGAREHDGAVRRSAAGRVEPRMRKRGRASYPHGAVAALDRKATTGRRGDARSRWHNLRVQFKRRGGGGVMGWLSMQSN